MNPNTIKLEQVYRSSEGQIMLSFHIWHENTDLGMAHISLDDIMNFAVPEKEE